MDTLKEFIDKNREAFEEELPEGSLERFEKKLNRKKAIVRRMSLWSLAAAACAALLVVWGISTEKREQTQAVFICEAEQEIEELREYYNMQMYSVVSQIEELHAADANPGTDLLWQETQRVMDASYAFEQNVYPNLPCSEAALFAMNQHYGNSLESLRYMLGCMEQAEKESKE